MPAYTIPDAAKSAAVDEITAAPHENALTELPAARFQLADTGKAHDAVQSAVVDKVVIDVGSTLE